MPTYKLPDGRILAGAAAQAEIDRQKKLEKEAKKAAQNKKVEALKSGDASAAAAAVAELASTKSSAGLSSAAAFQAAVLDEIRSGSHDYTFYHIVDLDGSQIHGSLHVSEESLREQYERAHGEKSGQSFEKFSSIVMKEQLLEPHPDLLKKNGKLAINIPEGSIVAIKIGEGVVHKHGVDFSQSSNVKLIHKSVSHNYICAIIPPDMESICIH